ncbi:Stage IV sporulation protein H [Leminorella richardii]|uniref:Stage IV sporulation protein H n=2 Tax=Leminorella richardii TaxID=158841 RepID=A0A2X4UNK4_9GAMM|nr:Stage IV sporulation protein H [Leminorella richardii]
MRWKKWAKELAVFMMVLAALIWGMDQWRRPEPPAIATLPEMTLTSGQTVSFVALSAEKPLLVYFWATWCGICKLTSPTVDELSREGVNVLSIAIRSGDDRRLIQGMSAKALTFPVVNDEQGRLSAEWGIGVTPTFVIIDKGKVVSSTTGWTSYWGIKARMWWGNQ